MLFLLAVLAQCQDVTGRSHKLGDSYIGPDNCNTCICKEAGNACTRRLCPVEATPRNAEADKCVDKDGILYEVGESYTHVDGCNTCRCTEHGGACTRRFCYQQVRGEKIRILSEIFKDKQER